MSPPLLGPDGQPISSASSSSGQAPKPAATPGATPTVNPSLHVDSDWKAQAQAERERLAKIDEEVSKEDAARRGGDELPPADMKSLVGVLASQAMMGLGAYGDDQGRVIIDLVGSRFAIDLIGVLEEKTKGNLTPDETTHLQTVARELRSQFVRVSAMVAQQMAAQGAGGTAGGAPRPPSR